MIPRARGLPGGAPALFVAHLGRGSGWQGGVVAHRWVATANDGSFAASLADRGGKITEIPFVCVRV